MKEIVCPRSLALSLSFLFVMSALPLIAQQTPNQQLASPRQSATQPSAQRPQAPPSAQPPSPAGQPDDPKAQAQDKDSGGQVFAGTIVKVGDKYVLQDSATGTKYDIDRQDLAKNYEGKPVRIKGTLDPDGKTIHVK